MRSVALLLSTAALLGGCNVAASPAGDASTTYREDFNTTAAQVPCPRAGRNVVAVIVGQSNAANHAAERTTADARAVVFYRGACYRAEDPLLGATGDGGSVWPTFAGDLLATGRFDHVILVPAAVGASRMEAWAPGGVLAARIDQRLAELDAAGFAPTHILVQQGEAEGAQGGDPVAYQADATALLARLAQTRATVVLALASRCLGEPNTAIRQAQLSAVRNAGAKVGPDADAIANSNRVEGCHYDLEAQRTMGRLWATTILR